MNQVNLADLAQRLVWLRKRRGLTQEQLAERCRAARAKLFPVEWLPRVPHVRRDRIAKLELAACPGASGARSVWDHEIRLLAAALDVPETWLSGTTNGTIAFLWDCTTDPAQARAIADLIAFHEEHSRERWAWTRSLPSTLQTPTFFHRYAELTAFSTTMDSSPGTNPSVIAESLKLVGDANRERTLPLLNDGKLRFFVVLPASTITAIARGTGLYNKIPPRARLQCLQGLVEQVENLKTTLHVALLDWSVPEKALRWLSSYEDVYVSGGLAGWTDCNMLRYLSESPLVFHTMRERVQEVFQLARYKRREEVLAFVRSEIDALATALGASGTKPSMKRVAGSVKRRVRTWAVGQVVLAKSGNGKLRAT